MLIFDLDDLLVNSSIGGLNLNPKSSFDMNLISRKLLKVYLKYG